MDATPYSILRSEELDSRPDFKRTLHHYEPGDLKVMVTEREGRTSDVEVFHWRPDGPDGQGRRSKVASIDLYKRYSLGKWAATMSGPSWDCIDMAEAKDLLGALQVAGAWFALVRQEAQSLSGED